MARNQTARPCAENRLDPGELSIFLAGCTPGAARIVSALRAVVRRRARGASEGIRFNCVCFFAPGKHFGSIGGNICMVEARSSGVRLSFIHGAVLADPARLLRGEGKHKRYVEVRSIAEARSGEVGALVRRAVMHAGRAEERRLGRTGKPGAR